MTMDTIDRTSQNDTTIERGTRRPAVLAWMRLARVYQKIDRATADHLRAHELSVAQFDVLAQVGAREGLTQKELAAALLVTKGNVCQLLDKMEARGLVERRPARTGRGNHLYLTGEGRRLSSTAVPAQEDLIADRFTALSTAEHQQLLTLLRKLDQSLDHPEEE
jgi:DNA-binding MarR family transcriptional regulator